MLLWSSELTWGIFSQQGELKFYFFRPAEELFRVPFSESENERGGIPEKRRRGNNNDLFTRKWKWKVKCDFSSPTYWNLARGTWDSGTRNTFGTTSRSRDKVEQKTGLSSTFTLGVASLKPCSGIFTITVLRYE